MLTVGTEDFRAAAAKLKELDKPVQAAWRKELKAEAKPIGMDALKRGADAMPHKGGLAARIAGGSASVSATGQKVEISLTTKYGDKLTAEERGTIRHPVFMRGRRGSIGGGTFTGKVTKAGYRAHRKATAQARKGWAWRDQSVPAGKFGEAFLAHRDDLADKVMAATEQAVREGMGGK